MQLCFVKKISKGYEKSGKTTYEIGTGWFSKYPEPSCCFAIHALATEKGPKNLHFLCKDSCSRDRWIEAISTLVKYKKSSNKFGLKK